MSFEKTVGDVEFSQEGVQHELERILASDKFARSKRLRSLLTFTVSQTLQGNTETLKEYVIGTEVLEKPETFDPRHDSLVRVLANRLRVKLKEYYSNGGSNDPLVIEFPKGRYVPRFKPREFLDIENQKKLQARNACSFTKLLATKLSEPVLAEAAERLEEAVESDPSFAPARAGLATTYAFQVFLGFRRPGETWPMVKSHAEAALAGDEICAEAQICLGVVSAFMEHRWTDAEQHFHAAIENDAYSSAPHLWRALASQIPAGLAADACRDITTARELGPTPFMEEGELLALYFAGRYDEILSRTAEPAHPSRLADWRPWLRSCVLAALGRSREAIELLEPIPERSVRIASMLGYLYGATGEREKAQAMLSACAQRRDRGEWVGNYELALIHAGLGQSMEALRLLLEAAREKEPWVAYLSGDPRFVGLRDTSDFGAITLAANAGGVEKAGEKEDRRAAIAD